jgi:hypothetical protein
LLVFAHTAGEVYFPPAIEAAGSAVGIIFSFPVAIFRSSRERSDFTRPTLESASIIDGNFAVRELPSVWREYADL